MKHKMLQTAKNQYTESAHLFFQESAIRINEKMTNMDIFQSVLNFAIGMERLLKGIIFSINPTYILVTPEFNHSLRVLYKDKIINNNERDSILANTPTADVITFKNSLLRAAEISRATQKNKNRLFGLSNLRDIIVHNDLDWIDKAKASLLMKRDFYFILLDFSDEIGIPRKDLFGNNEDRIREISKLYQEDRANLLRIKLEEYEKKWNSISRNQEIINQMRARTDELLESVRRYETTCPACNQSAVLFAEADYIVDLENAEKLVAGEFVRLIRCEFCGLRISDEIELDELGYGKSFNPYVDEFDDDIPF
ncbi:hypothetical protein ACH518_10615 [Methylomonas sp. HW2-6]|uniref:hypothetical protein n=1 Tax=Methylomonas sp. HW2-6 TaxID=3376687 RepID=UPI004042CDEF